MLLSLVSSSLPALSPSLVPPLATSSCCPPLLFSVCDAGPPSCWSTWAFSVELLGALFSGVMPLTLRGLRDLCRPLSITAPGSDQAAPVR